MKKEMIEPTIGELMAAYREIAALERIKSGRPSLRRVDNVLCGVRAVCKWAGVPSNALLSALTPQCLDLFFLSASKAGIKRVTMRSYIDSIRAITAKWCRTYYHGRGWKIPAFERPPIRRDVIRYERPSAETLSKVRLWYSSLAKSHDTTPWLAATLMLEFAMRNGDATRLTWDSFERRGDRMLLCYTPNKTALSSGRVVRWPVHPDLWRAMSRLRGEGRQRVIKNGEIVYRRLNADLRKLGFAGSKATYELRKICIDHIYQRFGAEMAVSISGDDIRTVTRYYADPSAVVQDSVRVLDMLPDASCTK